MKRVYLFGIIFIGLFFIGCTGKTNPKVKDYSNVTCTGVIQQLDYENGYNQGYLSKNDYDDRTTRDCSNWFKVFVELRRTQGLSTDTLEKTDCFCGGFYDGYDEKQKRY